VDGRGALLTQFPLPDFQLCGPAIQAGGAVGREGDSRGGKEYFKTRHGEALGLIAEPVQPDQAVRQDGVCGGQRLVFRDTEKRPTSSALSSQPPRVTSGEGVLEVGTVTDPLE